MPPERILLSPGTSISYFYCFKLLAESGDEILCPSPSYPLFETIAQLCNVRFTPYLAPRVAKAGRLIWSILNLSSRRGPAPLCSSRLTTQRVPWRTGLSCEGLAEIAARHRLAVIADEVFSEFLFGLDELPRPAQTQAPLVFTLNGFSKMLALPGMKLGWIGVSGEPALVQKSMRTLEMMSDTFLASE